MLASSPLDLPGRASALQQRSRGREQPRYDYLVVGAGFFGAAFAREMTDAGSRCLVIEARDHIAGNAFTEEREGIPVHAHGPHIFHCSDERIWAWVNRFAEFNSYVHTPKVSHGERIYSFPINLMTLYQLWGVSTPEAAAQRLEQVREPIEEPANLEEWVLAQVGREIYETFIRGYTAKQWQRDPRELPASIVKRLPIRLTFDENYFFDRHQGIPVGGYTRMFERMLEGIDVRLGVDFLESRAELSRLGRTVVWSGKLDAWFDYRFGELEYRSLRFEHELVERHNVQGTAQMNYTSLEVPFTRIVEHKHFEWERLARLPVSVVTREYACEWTREETPYYPVNDTRNDRLRDRYRELADATPDVIFGGRLAEYRYYDMHQVIGAALVAARREVHGARQPRLELAV